MTNTCTFLNVRNLYVIRLELDVTLVLCLSVCQQQTGPNHFRLTVRAVFSCEAPTVNDTDYTAECDLTLPTPTTDTPVVSSCLLFLSLPGG